MAGYNPIALVGTKIKKIDEKDYIATTDKDGNTITVDDDWNIVTTDKDSNIIMVNKDITLIEDITIPAPSSYQYDWEDISKSNAGRTEDLAMHKNRVGRVISLSLAWDRVSITNCKKILKAFNTEYVYVKYLDALTGGFVTRGFYTGNVAAPLFNTQTEKWESLSLNLTTRENAL